jgi:hypothetical protein
MNVYFCNINKINEEVDNFVIAKNKIEQPLIDNEELEKKMSIQEFLDYIDLTQNIFMANDAYNTAIPFKIYKPTEENVVIIYALEKNIENVEESFKAALKNIKYNLSNLKELTQIEILEGATQDKSYYIINNEFYM